MVHQTISTSTIPRAQCFKQNQTHDKRTPVAGRARDRSNARRLLGRHAAARRCAAAAHAARGHERRRASCGPLTGSLAHPKSRWVPVPWSELPGFGDDALHEGWVALIANCARPNAAFAPLCREVRQLALAETDEQREWMQQRLQPYRVESLAGQSEGKLTSYYEPVFEASRRPTATHTVPLYQAPAGLVARRPWYTRQEIDTLPAGAGRAARPRDRLAGRSDRRADAAHPGLGAPAHHRGRRLAAHRARGLRRPPTSSPTAASSNGC